MPTFNRVLFLSLGSVCLLLIPFFWLALVFDYKALENVMVSLAKSYFVGYPVPELFGANKIDSVVSQVFRVKIFLSLFLLSYSLFFLALYSVEENSRRFKFLFRGISIPLFALVVIFWIKFTNEDHIITHDEKTELFLATTISLVISIFLFAYSFRSKKKSPLKFSNNLPIIKKSVAGNTTSIPKDSSTSELEGETNSESNDIDSESINDKEILSEPSDSGIEEVAKSLDLPEDNDLNEKTDKDENIKNTSDQNLEEEGGASEHIGSSITETESETKPNEDPVSGESSEATIEKSVENNESP
ncbi:MAG: hypothetical protein HN553_03160 [Opitutae bacterium]|nr:hypothetical protein [Opitutae bacterium]